MADKENAVKSQNNGVQNVTTTQGVNNKDTEVKPTVLPKKTQPVEVMSTPQVKEVKNPVVKDPQGMFDYSDCQSYVVKNGDTLLDVAQKFAVALQQLRYFNHIDKAKMSIKPGKTLYIPKKPIYVPYGE